MADEKDQAVDPNYVKAFNYGYRLETHRPELLRTILEGSQGQSSYLDALRDGQKERRLERVRDNARHPLPGEGGGGSDRVKGYMDKYHSKEEPGKDKSPPGGRE